MEFRVRCVLLILLALLCFCICDSPLLIFAENENTLEVVQHDMQTRDFCADLKSFDVSINGHVLLCFQDASPYSNCLIQILDSDGDFIAEYAIASTQSGSLLSCFSDDGEILIHFIRSNETYSIQGNTYFSTTIPEEELVEVRVPPMTQKGEVVHSYGDSIYTLSSPGYVNSLFYGRGYELIWQNGDDEVLIWSSETRATQRKINRSLLITLLMFNIITLVFNIKWVQNKCSFNNGNVRIVLRIAIIIAIWLTIAILESAAAGITWKDIDPIWLFFSVILFFVISVLVDWNVLHKHSIK